MARARRAVIEPLTDLCLREMRRSLPLYDLAELPEYLVLKLLLSIVADGAACAARPRACVHVWWRRRGHASTTQVRSQSA
jgi:hypothetical protein